MTLILTAHQLGASNTARAMIEANGGRWAKVVEAFGEIPGYRRDFPGVKIIGRRVTHGDWSAERFDPVSSAHADFAVVLAEHRVNPCEYWESGNEIIPENYAQMRKIAEYDAQFVMLCEANGMRACVGNFATGTPGKLVEPITASQSIARYWMLYHSVLQRAAEGGHLVGFHEYIGQPADDTWLQYRYRHMIEYCRTAGIAVPHIAITECGVDGWKARGEDAFVEALAHYELVVRQNAEVLVACLFTSGTNGSAQWDAHDIDGSQIPQRLAAFGHDRPLMVAMPEFNDVKPLFSFDGAGALFVLYNRPGGDVIGRRKADYTVDVWETRGTWWRVGKNRNMWARASFV